MHRSSFGRAASSPPPREGDRRPRAVATSTEGSLPPRGRDGRRGGQGRPGAPAPRPSGRNPPRRGRSSHRSGIRRGGRHRTASAGRARVGSGRIRRAGRCRASSTPRRLAGHVGRGGGRPRRGDGRRSARRADPVRRWVGGRPLPRSGRTRAPRPAPRRSGRACASSRRVAGGRRVSPARRARSQTWTDRSAAAGGAPTDEGSERARGRHHRLDVTLGRSVGLRRLGRGR